MPNLAQVLPFPAVASKQQYLPASNTWYLIFPHGGSAPPQIVGSWEEAEKWKERGCAVEIYERVLRPN